MQKRILVIGVTTVCVIVLLMPYCYERKAHRILPLNVRNPVSHVYQVSFDSLFSIIETYGRAQDSLSPFRKLGYKIKMCVRGLRKGSDGEIEFFTRSAPSAIYRSDTGGLESFYQCRLLCDSLSPNRTEVKIESLYYGVLTGWNKYFWTKRKLPWIASLPSSSIEEYQLLHFIGTLVGEKGMHAVRYPKELTQEEIDVLENQR